VTYLDLGANHPICLSNTCKLSYRGGVGVLVEPNIELCKVIKKFRKKDICLNAGVGISETETMKDYYVMSSDVLNTFSKEEAEKVASYGTVSIRKVMPVPLFTLNQILSKYFPNQAPTVVSLDIEGLELEILQSADLETYRPMIFCIETLEYNEKEPGKKNETLIAYMQSKGYFVYADTYINTIFVDAMRFKSRFVELRKAKEIKHE